MSINYGDSGIIVNYIQMFLKEYYSRFIDIEYEYSKDIQKILLNYLNTPDSVTMNEIRIKIIEELSDYLSDGRSGIVTRNINYYFVPEEKIDEIVYTSKLRNTDKYPDSTTNEHVFWLSNNIKLLDSFLLKYGWHVENYNYRNTEDKCEVIISKIRENILPKSRLIDLVNMIDKIYTETSFAKPSPDSGVSIDQDEYYLSSLYNFEIKNYDSEIKDRDFSYNLLATPYLNIGISKDNGKYVLIDNSTGEKIPGTDGFRGMKTITSTIIKSDDSKYYIVHLKVPKNYKLYSGFNYFPVTISYSKYIGSRKDIDYTVIESNDIEKVKVKFINKQILNNSDEYITMLITIPDYALSGEYKLCITFYDPDDEINNLLSFRVDKESIKSYPQNDVEAWLSSEDDRLSDYLNIKIINAKEYYSSPFIIHDLLISYILEQVVNEYSREEDIILIQKLANKLGYAYDKYSIGTYDENLKSFIKNIQESHIGKDGTYIKYDKGYTDPNTESIMNTLIIGGEL